MGGFITKKPDELQSKDPKEAEAHKSNLVFNPESQCIVHGYDGPFVMDKSKWPTLTLPKEIEPTEELTQEDSLTKQSAVREEARQGFQAKGKMSN